jgi:hypothetical protein
MMCNGYECSCRGKISCLGIIGIIVAALFTLIVGFIVGAYIAETIVSNIAAFAVLGAVLFLLAVIWLIAYICRCRTSC